MARLNDGPITADSLDAARRRFLRQNRELARINSSHCVRIHNLETEKSRLLSENLALHEENIQLRVELDEKREQSSHAEVKVADFQRQFDEQIQALQRLATTLNSFQDVSSKKRTEQPSSPPAIRDWRADVPRRSSVDEEWRLPTIVEDKYFPRRTLNADEIQSVLLDQSTDSPELGPPPVVNFHLEDPVKFDTERKETMDVSSDREFVPSDLPANLESRKKRRDGPRLEIHRSSDFEKFPADHAQGDSSEARKVRLPLRNAAKRKYHDRDGNVPEAVTNASERDFCYSRKGERQLEQLPVLQDDSLNETAPFSKDVQVPSVSRRVLGDKSVNTDPVTSPKKARVQKPPLADDHQKPKNVPRNRFTSRKQQSHGDPVTALRPQSPEKVQTSKDVLPVDHSAILSNTTTVTSPKASSTAQPARPKSRDTPPPTDFLPTAHTSADALSEQSRPSRRARAAVNYAEPNLNRKMRRPTGAMMDAIGREERRQSSAEEMVSVKTEETSEDVNHIPAISSPIDASDDCSRDRVSDVAPSGPKQRAVMVKTEETPQFDWKNLPLASSKLLDPNGGGSVAEDTGKHEETKQPEDPPSSAASSVISALATAGKPPSRRRESLLKPSNTIKSAAETKEYPDYRARRSSSSSSSSIGGSNSNNGKSIFEVRSSPVADALENGAGFANDAAGIAPAACADESSSSRAKRTNSGRARRMSVGPGSIAPVAGGRKERTKDMAIKRTGGKGLVIHRHAGRSEAEDNSSSPGEEQVKNSGNVSDVLMKGGRAASRRRSMLL